MEPSEWWNVVNFVSNTLSIVSRIFRPSSIIFSTLPWRLTTETTLYDKFRMSSCFRLLLNYSRSSILSSEFSAKKSGTKSTGRIESTKSLLSLFASSNLISDLMILTSSTSKLTLLKRSSSLARLFMQTVKSKIFYRLIDFYVFSNDEFWWLSVSFSLLS